MFFTLGSIHKVDKLTRSGTRSYTTGLMTGLIPDDRLVRLELQPINGLQFSGTLNVCEDHRGRMVIIDCDRLTLSIINNPTILMIAQK